MNDPSPVPTPSNWTPNGSAGTSSVAVAVVGISVWVLKAACNITVPADIMVYMGIVAAYLGTYLHPAGRAPKA
jgi:hypothetical protein